MTKWAVGSDKITFHTFRLFRLALFVFQHLDSSRTIRHLDALSPHPSIDDVLQDVLESRSECG